MVFGWGKKKQDRTAEPVEETPQSKEIILLDIPEIISELSELRRSQTLTEINRLRNDTEPLIGDLMKIGNLLEKDSLQIGDIDKHLAIIVVRGKQQVIDVIKKGVISLPKISTFDDAKKLDSVLNVILKKVGDVLGRQTRVIHIFAKKYASQLKENLEVMNENHAEISRLLKNFDSTQSQHAEMSDMLSQIKHSSEVRKEKSQKIIETGKITESLNQTISLLENSIEKIHSSDPYKRYVDLKDTLNAFGNEKLKIKNDIATQFTKISRPLSRYEYASSLDKDQKNILSGLVKEPFDVLTPNNKDSVLIILENVRKGISTGSISVKDADKTSSQITEIEESLEVFVKRVSDYYVKYEQMKNEISSMIPDDLIPSENDLTKNISLRDQSLSRSKAYRDEIDEIDSRIPKLISGIEGKLRKFSNTKYTVLQS
ncbi:MAG: exonuclease SbcC [Nitrosopumilus sp.]|nr:MAG: exonuclease SbcC [Nitrosopumilus sp.]